MHVVCVSAVVLMGCRSSTDVAKAGRDSGIITVYSPQKPRLHHWIQVSAAALLPSNPFRCSQASLFKNKKIAPQSGRNSSAPWRKQISRWWPNWKSQHGARTHARTTPDQVQVEKKKKKRKKSRAPHLWCHLPFIFALQNKINKKQIRRINVPR